MKPCGSRWSIIVLLNHLCISSWWSLCLFCSWCIWTMPMPARNIFYFSLLLISFWIYSGLARFVFLSIVTNKLSRSLMTSNTCRFCEEFFLFLIFILIILWSVHVLWSNFYFPNYNLEFKIWLVIQFGNNLPSFYGDKFILLATVK